MLTVHEVAAQLQFSEEQVRRWLREGRLRGAVVSDRGGWRIEPAEVRRFVRDGFKAHQEGREVDPRAFRQHQEGRDDG